MKKRNYAGAQAIDTLISLVSFQHLISIAGGIVMFYVAIQSNPSMISIALGLIISSIPLYILKILLKAIESIVIASDMYIEHMEIEREKCAESVQKEE